MKKLMSGGSGNFFTGNWNRIIFNFKTPDRTFEDNVICRRSIYFVNPPEIILAVFQTTGIKTGRSLARALYQRLRLFNVWQQAGVVFVMVGINQLLCQWVENFTGAGARSALFMLPALSSALLWPFVLHSLRALRRYYEVT